MEQQFPENRDHWQVNIFHLAYLVIRRIVSRPFLFDTSYTLPTAFINEIKMRKFHFIKVSYFTLFAGSPLFPNSSNSSQLTLHGGSLAPPHENWKWSRNNNIPKSCHNLIFLKLCQLIELLTMTEAMPTYFPFTGIMGLYQHVQSF